MSVNIKALGLLEDNVQSSQTSEICEQKWLEWYNNVQKLIELLQKLTENDEVKKLNIILNTLLNVPKCTIELKCDMDIYLKYLYSTEKYNIDVKKVIPITIYMSKGERQIAKKEQLRVQKLWDSIIFEIKNL